MQRAEPATLRRISRRRATITAAGPAPIDWNHRGIDQGRHDHQPFNWNGQQVNPVPDGQRPQAWGFWFGPVVDSAVSDGSSSAAGHRSRWPAASSSRRRQVGHGVAHPLPRCTQCRHVGAGPQHLAGHRGQHRPRRRTPEGAPSASGRPPWPAPRAPSTGRPTRCDGHHVDSVAPTARRPSPVRRRRPVDGFRIIDDGFRHRALHQGDRCALHRWQIGIGRRGRPNTPRPLVAATDQKVAAADRIRDTATP